MTSKGMYLFFLRAEENRSFKDNASFSRRQGERAIMTAVSLYSKSLAEDTFKFLVLIYSSVTF